MITARRDPFGLVPVHYGPGSTLWGTQVGSRMEHVHAQGVPWSEIDLLPAGCDLHLGTGEIVPWYALPSRRFDHDRQTAAGWVREHLDVACANLTTSEPAAILLSGGIDSAAVAVGLLSAGQSLTAYTAVYDPSSPDLRSARQVAAHLGIQLVEVEIPHPTPDDLRETVRVIEQPFKAQVEIGWPCLVLGREIARAGHRVVYGGEGSDELWASHAFAFYERSRPGAPDWYEYRRRDFMKQSARNFIREWKVWDHHGLEVRLPFLDPGVVEYILGLPEDTCRDSTWHTKRPLQDAFRGDLPRWVCERKKMGFQDGLGIKKPLAAGLGRTQRQTGEWYREQFKDLFPGARVPMVRELASRSLSRTSKDG